MPRQQREELERPARQGERTLSQQVRMAVREHLERHEREAGKQ